MKPIPTIQELFNRLTGDIQNRLNLTDDQKLVVDAMGATLAAEIKLLYLYQNDVQRNLFADTADPAEEGGELNRIGQIYLKRQPFPAQDGYYTASVSGVAGSVLRAGLTFKSNDNSKSPGNLYIQDTEYTLTGTGDVIALRSLAAGVDYLLAVGDGLTVTEPVIGLNQAVVITAVTTQPTAGEDTPLYRKNTLDAIVLEPQGGARTDYRIWAADAPGVERIFNYVKNGDAGTVQVYVEATEVDSTDGKGTPSGALLDAVRAVIEFDPDETLPTNARGRRPMQAAIEMLPISVKPVDITITGLQTDTTAIRDSIATNLATYLFDVRPYLAGADLPRDKNDILSTVRVQSEVIDTIGNANTFTDFSLSVDGVVVNSFTFDLGVIPYLRNITYNL